MLKFAKALLVAGLVASACAYAAPPKIAVANLAYEQQVEEYFRVVAASSKENFSAGSNHIRASSSDQYLEVEGTTIRIDRGELRRFTADIKGELLKLRSVQIIEARGYKPGKNNEKLFDVIARIKRGDFTGADYVLFGTVSAIESQDNENPIAGTSTLSVARSMELVADFSLINTKNYTVKAAFSAMGEGSDVKLVGSEGAYITHHNGKIVAEVSKSLGRNVVEHVTQQFQGLGAPDQRVDDGVGNLPAANRSAPEEVMVLTPAAPAK